MDASQLAAQLLRDGYLIAPSAYVSEGKTLETSSLRADWEQVFLASPEFKLHPRFDELDDERVYVCGATAFAGNPSVCHNMVSRRHRMQTTAALMPIFVELVKQLERADLKMCFMPDRVQVRGPKRSPSKESWHRDFPAVQSAGEYWLGGWENCDPEPQYFCAIKGTHFEGAASSGFSKIAKGEHAELDARLLAQANQPDTNKQGKIVIPPKHFLLSFGTLVHAINPTKFAYTSVKAFLGTYRFTARDDSGIMHPDKSRLLTHEEIAARMAANDVTIMSSGQYPPFYPGNYLVCRDKQLHLFERARDTMLVEGAMKFPLYNEAGELVHKSHKDETRSFKSLAAMGLPLYPPYQAHELELMRPRREVALPNAEGQIELVSLYPERPLKRARPSL
jgi:hypothetical protein